METNPSMLWLLVTDRATAHVVYGVGSATEGVSQGVIYFCDGPTPNISDECLKVMTDLTHSARVPVPMGVRINPTTRFTRPITVGG